MTSASPARSASDHLAELAHAMLRPGAEITMHSDDFLQVGLHTPGAVVLRHTEQVRELLEQLRVGASPIELGPDTAPAWQRLAEADLLVDADAYFNRLPVDEAARSSRSAVYADHTLSAPALLRNRSELAVAVDADALGDEALGDEARRLLSLAGVSLTGPPAVRLVIADRELSRARLDRAMQASLPHLVVRSTEGRVVLGPFVVPGVTACLRCVDLHHSESEPRRPLIIEQYAAAADSTTVARPVDHARLGLATAWAVIDVLAYLDGEQPTTWSSTLTVDAARRFTPQRWPRHPHCGCSWTGGWADTHTSVPSVEASIEPPGVEAG
ncbi:MAG: hypothetical protein WAW88_04425, partial [Nocardioides sp.]